MTFLLSGLRRSGKPLRRKDHTQKGSSHALQALFPMRRKLLPVRGLLRKSITLRHPLLLLPSLQEGRLRGGGGGSWDAPGAASHEASSLPARFRSSERGGGVSGCLSGARERAPVFSTPSVAEGGGGGLLLVRSGLPMPAPLTLSPLPAYHSILCDVVSQESLRRSAPVLDPPVFPDLRIEEQGRIAGLALGWPALVAIPIVLALALLTARSQVVESVGDWPRLGRCPSASGRDVIGHGLKTAPDLVAFALALGEAVAILGSLPVSPRSLLM